MRKTIALSQLLLLLYSNFICGQNIILVKDSVFYENNYIILQDIKINTKNKIINDKVYKTIHSSQENIGCSTSYTTEANLKTKKETLLKYINDSVLMENTFPLEDYKINYNGNNIINLSITYKVIGDPQEGIEYFIIDLLNGEKIDSVFFIDRKKLIGLCNRKMKEEGADFYRILKSSDLAPFQIITDTNKKILYINFFIYDTDNYYGHTNSNYPEYTLHFTWKEIRQFIAPMFKKRLL